MEKTLLVIQYKASAPEMLYEMKTTMIGKKYFIWVFMALAMSFCLPAPTLGCAPMDKLI